jgi:transcriptional regulator with XRE-family HTH domain
MGYKSIGRRLQLAREEAGLSQEQLAAKIGCSQSTLSNYEKGKRRLYLAQLERIAEELQKPIEYFMQPLPGETSDYTDQADWAGDTDLRALLEALDKLSPAGKRLAVDFAVWLVQREEKA